MAAFDAFSVNVFSFLPCLLFPNFPIFHPSMAAILAGKVLLCLPWQRDNKHRKLLCQKVCSSYAGWVVCEGAVWVTRELKGKEIGVPGELSIKTVDSPEIPIYKSFSLSLSLDLVPFRADPDPFLRFYFWSNDSLSIDRISSCGPFVRT